MDSSLWYYFWSEIDAEEDHTNAEIRTLKLLASIGYTNAHAALKKHLEKYDETDKDDSGVSMLDYSSKDGNTDPWSVPDLTVWECELDEEGVLEVEYLKPPKSNPVTGRTEQSVTDDDDESESIGGGDSVGYIYGGPEVEDTSGWSRLGLLPDPWAEGRYPVIDMITSDDLNEAEVEPQLNLLTLSSGLTNFTLTPDEKGYGYTKLQLPGKGLRNIDLLKSYLYLQYVDLSNNKIEDLSPLWEISHLVVLDVSHNHLTDSSVGKPEQIWFLTYLNMSFNELTEVPDFSNCWSIKHFDLAHNKINKLSVVSDLKYLSYLNLSYNDLESIEDLNNKLLREVNFAYNRISSWQDPGPKAIQNLETINIAYNQLQTLSIFAEMYNLTTLDVSWNNISGMVEFDALKTLPVVKDLKIAGNQINTIISDAKSLIIYLVPSLERLDGVEISPLERVSAISHYRSNPLQDLIWQHSRRFYYRHTMNPTVGWERDKATGEHPGLIVLIGDIGSSRQIIADMVQKVNPHICKQVQMITTRPKVKYEVTNRRMKHVSLKKFNRIDKEGGFIVVQRRFGHMYGIASVELEDKNRVLLALLGMTAALELLWKGFNPTLIVMLPNQEEILTKRCLHRFQASTIYRTKFKVNSLIKERTSTTAEISNTSKQGETKKDGANDNTISTFSSVGRRKFPPKHRKRIAHTKKCSRMFTTVKSKKQKRKLGRLSKNSAEKNIILDEAYGVYFPQCPRSGIKTDWCGRPSFVWGGDVNSSIDDSTSTVSNTSSKKSFGIDDEQLRFVQNIVLNQMSYREMHIRNPGLFKLFISTDDLDKAANTLLAMVERKYEKLVESKKVKTVDMRSDPYYEQMVHEPIMKLIDKATSHDLPLEILL